MKGRRQAASDDVMAHLAKLRSDMTVEERAAYDERVLAVRTVLELVEQRKKRRLAQRTIADRMGVSQPVIARLEKPLEPSWRQPSLSVLSRYAAALGLVLEVRLRPAA
jgi:DNA-binding XRE family transcriptional regulator